jgi:hypothetical protein
MSILRRAKQDAKAADRAARERASGARRAAAEKRKELQSKAKQDVRAAERELRKRANEEQGRTAGNVDSPDSTREIFSMAGSAAGLRSPVEATLDPAPDGPGMEGFARGGGLSFGGSESSESDEQGSTGASVGLSFDAPDDDGSGGALAGLSFDSDGDDPDDDDVGVGVGLSFDGDNGGLL